MGAAALQVAHVPESAASGLVASVVADAKPTTLGSALREAGVSQGTIAEACGVSQQRVAQWACPDHDAEPHLGHVRRMPRSVRVEEARDRGDRKALVALLRELTATQDDMSRFVAGVRVAMEATR